MRAIRGAITVEKNTREDILEASGELLKEIIELNEIETEELVSILFTATTGYWTLYIQLWQPERWGWTGSPCSVFTGNGGAGFTGQVYPGAGFH